LQLGMPGGGAEVVAMESAAAIPGDRGGSGETQPSKPALPGTSAEPEAPNARGG
jgi:hypothetical protein